MTDTDNKEPEMKSVCELVVKIVLVLFSVAVVFGIPWLILSNDLLLTKFFTPKFEEVRRETFEQSKSYKQGVIQELESMQFEYVKAEQKHKDALGSVILRRVADYDLDELPAGLRAFVTELRRGRGLSN